MPDEELLRAADSGELRKPGVLAAQVKRMLADAEVRCAGRELCRAVAGVAVDGAAKAGSGEVSA